MKIKLRTLLTALFVLIAITLWALIDSASAYTKPIIRFSDLSWSSYHSYHCIKQWCDDTDEMIIYMSKMRSTLLQAQKNRKWAKKKVKKLHLMRYSPYKRLIRICDYIDDNWEYDSSQIWVEQAIKTHRANCSAYADLVYILCKASHLPVQYMIGWVAYNPPGWHCWNRVKVKGKWYWVDITGGYYPTKKLWKTHGRIIETW